jgi:hypothetical protein
MEIAVRAHLINDPAVRSLVDTRIYPDVLPQGVTYPAIRYQRIDTPRTYTKGGSAGLSRPRLQIDCYATTYKAAKDTADAVRAAMERFTGPAVCENEQDGYEPDPEPAVYVRTLEFRIWHEEA